ncbi:voltage-gated potassium channel [Aureococcus anophagefferens]|nr:voltage-gated potassium channel [Aureococcus anophagefferens]
MPEKSDAKTIIFEAIFFSELVNFFLWFLKFAPLFLLLFPIHRAQWFQGGDLADYLLCKRGWCAYLDSPNYGNPDFPRGTSGGFSLSTFRRKSEIQAYKARVTELARKAEAAPKLATSGDASALV